MFNDILLHEHDDVTPFSAKLMELTKDGREQIVRLQNGNLLEVSYWFDEVFGNPHGFRNYKGGNSFNFYIDGTCSASRQFDIIEIVGI